jgi:sugar lactone lactonase YvrE
MRHFVVWLLSLLLCGLSLAQNINTIVGGGSPAGPALSAYVAGPTDVVQDSKGNTYVSGIDDEYVVKLDANGRVTVFAGTGYAGFVGVGGPATKATVTTPNGLAVDKQGNILISDQLNQHVYKVNVSTGLLTNVAGSSSAANPVGGYSGDGGPATSALLDFPQGIAAGATGNIAIADSGNNVVRLVDVNGIITTFAGMQNVPCSPPTARCGDGGPASKANLNFPTGVAFDSAGNTYIADANDNRIRVVNKAGVISTIAGNGNFCSTSSCGDGGPAKSATLNFPNHVFIDKLGNVYIADQLDQKIRFVNAATHVISTIAGNGGYGFSGDGGSATSATMADPTSVFVDKAGNAYIADQGSNRVRKVSAGIIQSIAGGGSGSDNGPAKKSIFAWAYDLALDAARNMFIIDFDTGRIRRVDASTKVITTVVGNGTSAYSGDGGPATGATLDYPRGLTLDSSGNMYIADSVNYVVRLVQSGIISTFAGNGIGCFPSTLNCGDGGPASQANLTHPESVVIDGAGNVYIADTQDHRVRRVDNTPQHTITTYVGTGTPCAVSTDGCGDGGAAISADLNLPTGLAIDSAGNLFIADSLDNRIRRVDAVTKAITTVAFDGQPTFGGDNGPALLASMQAPNKIAIDAAGNLFVSGGSDNVVRKIDAATQLASTVAGDAQNPLAFGFSGDGGPALKAVLSNRGLALDSSGGLYIADNNRIRFVPGIGEMAANPGK